MANIPIEMLKQMFDGMKNEAGWNIEGKLLWGYFFTHRQPRKLDSLASRLVEMGYRFVSLHEATDRSTYALHVERIEIHTPSSLFQRNTQMNMLAGEFEVHYDGMDAGPVLEGEGYTKRSTN